MASFNWPGGSGGGAGTVTTTGSPASGQIPFFTGASSISGGAATLTVAGVFGSGLFDDSNFLVAAGDHTKKVGWNCNGITAGQTVTLIFSDNGSGASITFPSGSGMLASVSGAASNGQSFTGTATNFANILTSKTNYRLDANEQAVTASGAATTIDFSLGSSVGLSLNASTTLTLTNMVAGGSYLFRVIQAGGFTLTAPGSVKYPGGVAPVITVTAGKYDLINLYYDGTNFEGSFSQNY